MFMFLVEYSSCFRKKVYKTHITKWGLDKKNKKCDMKAIARKYSEREQKGKASHFTVRGRTMHYAEVVRYFQRRGESIDDVVAQRTASKTPEAVKCFTPLRSPIRTPEALALPEQIFITIRYYHIGCFEAGIWVGDDEKSFCRTNKAHSDPYHSILRLRDRGSLALDLFDKSRFQEAGVVLRAATASIEEIVQGEHPHTLVELYSLVSDSWRAGRQEVSLAILRQFSAMAQLKLGEWHPLRLVCERLASASHLNFKDILLQSCRILCEVFTSVLGPLHKSTIDIRTEMVYLNLKFALSSQETSYQALLRECEINLGPYEPRTLDVRLDLAFEFLNQDNFREAKEMAETIITHADSDYHRNLGLDILAKAQYGLGETQEAETSLRAAIDLRRSCWGDDNGDVQRWMLELEGWLEARGDFEGAAQVHEERMVAWESTILPASNE